ncbi:bacterial proteasome activator family protein [Nocardioides sp.]|uniref:bacterial proteasome activator family protein n=1 Tax=Nocardioides sp. TaxID=35761 RepID=UPI002603A15F|nr:bacterial proteasome activator family protein [Nocardioides sp.]
MSEQSETPDVRIVDLSALASGHAAQAADEAEGGESERSITDLVEQPAKVMRIGSMIRQLLEEVKSAPLDEASRARLKEIHQASIKELEQGLAPELVEELDRLTLPFTEAAPSESELRIAQAQLVGWLEGLFHGIQTAIYAQQVAAQAQFEQIRRGLPPGASVQVQPQPTPPEEQQSQGPSGGMYL